MLQKPPNYGLFSGKFPETAGSGFREQCFLYVQYIVKYFSTITSSIISDIFVHKSIFIWNNCYFKS